MLLDRQSILEWSQPLVNATAFRRLSKLSFLGILSPRYRSIDCHPNASSLGKRDGNRAQHSIGVANIVFEAAHRLALSNKAIEYAVTWALLHDIATWPLSHTGEAGFSRVTDISSRQLRNAMIKGSYDLPQSLRVFYSVKQLSIQHDLLLALFDPVVDGGFDRDLRALHGLIHSPITPDTLEGMSRSGQVFGVPVPNPSQLVAALYRDIFSNVMIDRQRSSHIVSFWRRKSEIYDRHINNWRSIEFESAWSKAIEDAFARVPLADSLQLTERQIVGAVLTRNAPRFREVNRYKMPLSYQTSQVLARKRQLRQHLRLEDLSLYLSKAERAI